MSDVPNLFDAAARARAVARSKRLGQGPTFLQTAMLENVADRVHFIARRFSDALLLGDIPSAAWPDVADSATYSTADIFLAAKIAVEPASLDLVVSVGDLHVVNDVPGLLLHCRQVLKPDGLLIACFPGADTLHELRDAFVQAESRLTGSASLRVHPMMDVRDGGTLLQRAGFAMPVADVDRLDVTYATPLDLLLDLRCLGETSVLADRSRGCLRRDVLAAAADWYASHHRTDTGRIRATFALVTLSGWAPADSQPAPKRRGSATARLADALKPVGHLP
jgi:SAM-dependent methyltransferase